MPILSIISALLGLVRWLVDQAERRRLIDEGRRDAIAELTAAARKQVAEAKQVRRDFRDSYDPSDPRWVRDPNDRRNRQ